MSKENYEGWGNAETRAVALALMGAWKEALEQRNIRSKDELQTWVISSYDYTPDAIYTRSVLVRWYLLWQKLLMPEGFEERRYKLYVLAPNGFGEKVWKDGLGGAVTRKNAAFMRLGFYPEPDMQVRESIRKKIKTYESTEAQWYRIERIS